MQTPAERAIEDARPTESSAQSIGTIWALKGSDEGIDLHAALKHGEGRLGWSYSPTADLRKLTERIEQHRWDSLSEEEKDCNQRFLLEFPPGDYVVYINVPEWGKCTLAKVTGLYVWRFEDRDFDHRFDVDPSSVRVFERHAQEVHPNLRARLSLQGRKWRIYAKQEFATLVTALDNGAQPKPATPEHDLQLLAEEIKPFMKDVTRSIQRTHPNSQRRSLPAAVRSVPASVTPTSQPP